MLWQPYTSLCIMVIMIMFKLVLMDMMNGNDRYRVYIWHLLTVGPTSANYSKNIFFKDYLGCFMIIIIICEFINALLSEDKWLNVTVDIVQMIMMMMMMIIIIICELLWYGDDDDDDDADNDVVDDDDDVMMMIITI